MAGGILGFLGFGKREKPNLVSPVARPQAGSLSQNATLRRIAQERLNSGTGLGFGEDFVNKSGNPQAQRMRQDFLKYTDPYISNQASSMGLGRSNLALNRKALSAQENESNIDQMMADFYKMNEVQKKADYGQALQLGQNLDTQEAGLLSNAAAEGERVRDLTVGQSNARNAQADKMQGQTIQALGSLVGMVPGMGGVGTAFGALGGGGGNDVMSLLQKFGLGTKPPGPKTKTLSDDEWDELSSQYGGGY